MVIWPLDVDGLAAMAAMAEDVRMAMVLHVEFALKMSLDKKTSMRTYNDSRKNIVKSIVCDVSKVYVY